MTEPQIRFEDGASYETMMGIWSRLAGETFLDWLAAPAGRHWVDIGAGNGAFTELIVQRCAPSAVDGVDPSEGQLNFARTRPASRIAKFKQGDAMALPYPDKSFDVAVMALVLFFVPEPPKGVAEMVRVLRPGGIAAAYMWDMPGGGFPWAPLLDALRSLGHSRSGPPSADASRIEVMQKLWEDAGLVDVETREIAVQRTFASFEEFFAVCLMVPNVGPLVRTMAAADIDMLKARIRERLPSPDNQGRIICTAKANAVKGRLPQ